MPGCTSPKRQTQVHHIKRWADVEHARFDVSNGIVLCKSCHEKVTGNESLYAPMLQKLVAMAAPRRANVISALIMNRYAYGKEDEQDAP